MLTVRRGILFHADKVTNEPVIEIFTAHRGKHTVLGKGNTFKQSDRNPKCPHFWKLYEDLGARKLIKPYMTENAEIAIFCHHDEQYYNYFIGAVVENVDVTPEGLHLIEFPETEYLVVTHEWLSNKESANKKIGNIVAYAHSGKVKIPNGYEKYTEPVMFIESYNYDFTANKYRFEVWSPMRKINLGKIIFFVLK
jgi:predicted transcriptional regulator YdeE